MKSLNKIVSSLLVLVFLFSCRKQDKPSTVFQSIAPVLAPQTKVLDEQTMQQITNLDSSKVVIASDKENYKVGEIISAGISSKTPRGFLRRVKTIKETNGLKEYYTENVALNEAIEDGSYAINKVLKDEDIESFELAGTSPQYKKRTVEASIENGIQINQVLHDLDNNPKTTDDQINIIGSIKMEPVLKHELLIEDFTLKHLQMTVDLNSTTSVKITSKLEGAASKRIVLGKLKFKSMVAWIGYLPIVVTPELVLTIDFNGKLSSEFSTAVTMKESKTLGVAYNEAGFRTINERKAPAFSMDDPSLDIQMELKSVLGASFNFLFYDFESAKTSISADAFLRFKAADALNLLTKENELKWQLFWGYNCNAGINLVFFSKNILDKTFTLLNDEKLMKEGIAGSNTVKDIDGNVYKVIKIGDQKWMQSNLKTTRYNDSTPIPNVTSNNQWSSMASGAYCFYNNDPANNEFYGKLYNWHAVNTGKLCPAGWHVPTDAEWNVLSYAIFIKELRALPGGYRFPNGGYNAIGNSGTWWSSTEYNTNSAWYRYLYYNGGNAYRYDDGKRSGFSVRCLRD